MKYKIILIYIVVVAAAVGVGFWLFHSSQKAEENLPGQTFENLGQDHITEGSTEHVAYNSNPPTSGPHWPQPAAWGIYKATQPDEQLVHNLEHGGIWISFKPDKVDASTIAQLEDIANRFHLIIVEPREKNDSPISLAAWTHLENLDHYDEAAILTFINAYYNNGPEKVEVN